MKKLRVMTIFGPRPEAIKMAPLVLELAKRQPWFTLGETPAQGNLCWCLKPNGWHTYDDCYEYLWLLMPWLFSEQ